MRYFGLVQASPLSRLSLGPTFLVDQLRNFGGQLRFQQALFRVSKTKIRKYVSAAAFRLLVVRPRFMSRPCGAISNFDRSVSSLSSKAEALHLRISPCDPPN